MEYTQEAIFNSLMDSQKIGMNVNSIRVTQTRKTYIDCKATLFGNCEISFTVGLTPTGRIKKNSARVG